MADAEHDQAGFPSVSADDPSLASAVQRRDEYLRSLDPVLRKLEDDLPRKVRHLNASAATKLKRVFALVDELTERATNFVACAKGCSACCHMNVTISDLEARTIAEATGRGHQKLTRSREHDSGRFTGVPCPFLENSACSIYSLRPFACRKHVSFHTSDYWCQPQRSHERELPLVRFAGAEEAYFSVTGWQDRGIIADIRDFFPNEGAVNNREDSG